MAIHFHPSYPSSYENSSQPSNIKDNLDNLYIKLKIYINPHLKYTLNKLRRLKYHRHVCFIIIGLS